MSHVNNGPLPYNSLVDSNLAGFFNNTRLRRQLQKSGLITKRGVIVSENMYRLNMSKKEHKQHVKDMLAQAIVHKTLDLERARQAEIRRTLEQIAKIQLVRRVRESRSRKRDEDVLPYLSSGLRLQSSLSPLAASSHSHTRGRPVSAPARKGKQPLSELSSSYEDDEYVIYLDDEGRPISPSRLETSGSRYSSRQSSDTKHVTSGDPIDNRNLASLDTVALRKYAMLMAKMEQGRGGVCSPYLIPQVPLPPKSPRGTPNPRSISRYRPRKSDSPKRPSTSLYPSERAKIYRGQPETLCEVSMHYHGSGLSLAREEIDPRHDILVEQQHCGGNTLTVYKNKLEPNSSFSFVSYRHRGYPFSLSIYIEGQLDCQVSRCCEYRHNQGGRIGGKNGHFSITKIKGAVPCYRCQVERGSKIGYQAPRPKLKRPPKSLEEVTVQHSIERKTPGKKALGEASSSQNQLLVPVDNIEGQKQSDKYEDDFEASNKSSTSSSASDSDEKEYNNNRQERESNPHGKRQATLHFAERKSKNAEFQNPRSIVKKFAMDDTRAHRPPQQDYDDFVNDNCCCSDSSYCSDSVYSSDTSHCSNTSYCSNGPGKDHSYEYKKLMLLKIIEEDDQRRRSQRKDVFTDEGRNICSHFDNKVKKSKEMINDKKYFKNKPNNRGQISASRSSTDTNSETSRNVSSGIDNLHTSAVTGSESVGTEDEVSDFESEIASSKKYASIGNLSVSKFECMPVTSERRHNGYSVIKSVAAAGHSGSRSSSGYSFYQNPYDSVPKIKGRSRTEKRANNKLNVQFADTNKVECLTAFMVSDKNSKRILSSLRNNGTGGRNVCDNKKLILVSGNGRGKHHLKLPVAPASARLGEVEFVDEPTTNVDDFVLQDFCDKQGAVGKVYKTKGMAKMQERSHGDDQNRLTIQQVDTFRKFKQRDRCDVIDNEEEDPFFNSKNKYLVANVKNGQKAKEKPKFAKTLDKLVDTCTGHNYLREKSPYSDTLTFDGTVTKIPMVKTGENEHLIRQAKADAKRRRKSKAKRMKASGSSKNFRDLSPPVKLIRGYAGDSSGESNNDDFYSDLIIHGNQTNSNLYNSENKYSRNLISNKDKKNINTFQSEVELDESSIATEESLGCEVMTTETWRTVKHPKGLHLNAAKRTSERLNGNALEKVPQVVNKFQETYKQIDLEPCLSRVVNITPLSPHQSLILNASLLEKESSPKHTVDYQNNDTISEHNAYLKVDHHCFERQTTSKEISLKQDTDFQIKSRYPISKDVVSDSLKSPACSFKVISLSEQKKLPEIEITNEEQGLLKVLPEIKITDDEQGLPKVLPKIQITDDEQGFPTVLPEIQITDDEKGFPTVLPEIQITDDEKGFPTVLPEIQITDNEKGFPTVLPEIQITDDEQGLLKVLPEIQITDDEQGLPPMGLPEIQITEDKQGLLKVLPEIKITDNVRGLPKELPEIQITNNEQGLQKVIPEIQITEDEQRLLKVIPEIQITEDEQRLLKVIPEIQITKDEQRLLKVLPEIQITEDEQRLLKVLPEIQITDNEQGLLKTYQRNKATEAGKGLPKQKQANLTVVPCIRDRIEQAPWHTFFANDNQNTERYNSRAEIVGTRYVDSESDRYVKHQVAFHEVPVVTSKHFLNVGAAVSILRPQNPDEANLGFEPHPVLISVSQPKKIHRFQSPEQRLYVENSLENKDFSRKGHAKIVTNCHLVQNYDSGKDHISDLSFARSKSDIVNTVEDYAQSKDLKLNCKEICTVLTNKGNINDGLGSEDYYRSSKTAQLARRAINSDHYNADFMNKETKNKLNNCSIGMSSDINTRLGSQNLNESLENNENRHTRKSGLKIRKHLSVDAIENIFTNTIPDDENMKGQKVPVTIAPTLGVIVSETGDEVIVSETGDEVIVSETGDGVIVPDKIDVTEVIVPESTDEVIVPDKIDVTEVIVPEITDEVIVPEITDEVIVSETGDEVIVSETGDEVIVPDKIDVTEVIVPESTDEVIVPDKIDVTEVIVPEITDEVIVPEITDEVIVPEITDEVIVPESSDEVIVPESTDEVIVPERSDVTEVIVPDTSDVVIVKETSDVVIVPATSDEVIVPETSDGTEVIVPDTIDEVIVPETGDVTEVIVPETSDEVIVPETCDEVIVPDTTDEVIVPETSDEVIVPDTTDEVIVPETSNVTEVIVPETSDEVIVPDTTDEVIVPETSDVTEVIVPDTSDVTEVIVPDTSDEVIVPETSDVTEVIVPDTSDVTEVIVPDTSDEVIVPETNDGTEVIVPDTSDDTIVPEAKDVTKVIVPETSDEVIVPETSDEVIVPETSKVTEVIVPETSDEVIVPKTGDVTEVIVPDTSDEVIVPESSDEVIVPDNSDEVIVPESSGKFIVPETSDETDFIVPESSDVTEVIVPETSDVTEVIVPETSDVTEVIVLESSDEVIVPETCDVTEVIVPETSDEVIVPETNDVTEVIVPETSDEVIVLETSDVTEVIVPETSDEVIVPETSDEVIVPDTSDEVIVPETSDEVIVPETSDMTEVILLNKSESEF